MGKVRTSVINGTRMAPCKASEEQGLGRPLPGLADWLESPRVLSIEQAEELAKKCYEAIREEVHRQLGDGQSGEGPSVLRLALLSPPVALSVTRETNLLVFWRLFALLRDNHLEVVQPIYELMKEYDLPGSRFRLANPALSWRFVGFQELSLAAGDF